MGNMPINNFPNAFPLTGAGTVPISDLDSAKRGSANSIFGDKIVGTRSPSIAAQFQYGIGTDAAVEDTVGTGSVSFSNAMLYVSTGTDSNGHAGIQSKEYLRYKPGHEAYALFTAVFTTPVADTYQRTGLFDYDSGNGNGFFLGYEDEVFGITRRRGGVDTFEAVDVSTVFPANFDTFDPTKGNIYKISFGYLGFATIHFEVLTPEGNFVTLAKIQYPNSSTETHIANTNLPLRVEVGNTGNTTDIKIGVGSIAAGIVNGGGADVSARVFTQSLGTTTITGGVTTQLAHFRSKTTYNGISNKVKSQLILLSAATEGNKPVEWGIKRNATITTPGTWSDVDTDSTIESSTDAVVNLSTGKDILSWNMDKAGTFFEDVEQYQIVLRPGEWATIYVLSSSGSDVTLSIRYKDLF